MKIALIGYGKMGKIIERIAQERGHDIVCRIDVDNQQDFESSAFRTADVAIEFSTPKVAVENIYRAWKNGVKVVCGTTGWQQHMPEVKDTLKREKKTLFWTSNFSIGVNIFFEINRQLARLMNSYPQYDVRMKEIHHIHKLDAPSGTAVSLANDIIMNLERKDSWELGMQRSQNKLDIEALREGEVPGYHEVCYESIVDSITIAHNAKNREGFALGAVLAAEYTATHEGFLTMHDLMGL